MRKILLALSFVLAIPLFGQSADLRMLSATMSVTPASTADRVTMFARWRNNGPDPAHFVTVTVSGSPTPFYIVSVATSGWPCYSSPEGDIYTCVQNEFAAGEEAELVLQMLAPATPGPFDLHIEIDSADNDPQPNNNSADIASTLAPAPPADLAISPTSQLHQVEAGAEVSIPILVANNGPNDVSNVFAVFMLPFFAGNVPPMQASGSGWTCVHPPFGPQAMLCSRIELDAGEVAPITVTTAAPANGGSFTINARVGGEDHLDIAPANNSATATVTSAEVQASHGKILLPLAGGADVHGANGALWRTQLTALIASDTQIEILPRSCGNPILCLPAPLPLRTPFDPDEFGLTGTSTNLGQFLYVTAGDESKLHLNARVFDVSRETETAGSEIPIARETDFTTGTMSLLGIPVAPQYRHTLRVYDFDGRNGASVAIRFYAGAETTPRLSIVRTLSAPQNGEMPSFPGTIQLEIGQLLPLAGLDTIRVDVEPLDAGLRLWSFVSVTNNETHHVTTFSAQ
jgi:hypothetical protein